MRHIDQLSVSLYVGVFARRFNWGMGLLTFAHPNPALPLSTSETR
jgi:hypothetical protein